MNTSEFSTVELLERRLVANARVLVIDDDPDIHALVSAMLRPLQTTVEIALDGAAGLEVMTENPPDLILMDQEMPGRAARMCWR